MPRPTRQAARRSGSGVRGQSDIDRAIVVARSRSSMATIRSRACTAGAIVVAKMAFGFIIRRSFLFDEHPSEQPAQRFEAEQEPAGHLVFN